MDEAGPAPAETVCEACIVSVAARCRCSMRDKTSSWSEDQQRNTQGGHETNQQFHLNSFDERAVAGW
ncbi:MAG: hypothetical protein CPSOU_2869 [uncultured Paraburkholderia sp.]|nr:MAG: hypothetical protein CPSOU_2869 [uncultured Paraburkholderia sp.]